MAAVLAVGGGRMTCAHRNTSVSGYMLGELEVEICDRCGVTVRRGAPSVVVNAPLTPMRLDAASSPRPVLAGEVVMSASLRDALAACAFRLREPPPWFVATSPADYAQLEARLAAPRSDAKRAAGRKRKQRRGWR